jgi:AcrR family transcriptional regulator
MPPRTPRRMAPERRRAHLVATVLDLYGRMPPEQVGVDDVAAAADVSRALFYRYFGSMAQLHAAALGAVVDELLTRLRLPADGPPVERLRAAIDEFLTIVARHATAYVALLRSGSAVATGETAELVEGVRAHIVGLLLEPLLAMLVTTARHDPVTGAVAARLAPA